MGARSRRASPAGGRAARGCAGRSGRAFASFRACRRPVALPRAQHSAGAPCHDSCTWGDGGFMRVLSLQCIHYVGGLSPVLPSCMRMAAVAVAVVALPRGRYCCCSCEAEALMQAPLLSLSLLVVLSLVCRRRSWAARKHVLREVFDGLLHGSCHLRVHHRCMFGPPYAVEEPSRRCRQCRDHGQ